MALYDKFSVLNQPGLCPDAQTVDDYIDWINKNPDLSVHIEPDFITYIQNPTEALIWKALEIDPCVFANIQEPTERMICWAIDRGISNPHINYDLETKISMIQKKPHNIIKWLYDGSIPDHVIMRAIDNQPHLVYFISGRNISVELQKWFYNKYGSTWLFNDYCYPEVQILLAKTRPLDLTGLLHDVCYEAAAEAIAREPSCYHAMILSTETREKLLIEFPDLVDKQSKN